MAKKASNLPPRLRARKRWKTGKTFYYYDTGKSPNREIPLGHDYALALKKWAELEIDDKPRAQQVITFRYVSERYIKEIMLLKAPKTKKLNQFELKWLYKFFDNPPAPLDQIRPKHIKQYMDWREAKVSANREKALFSHIWNFAREKGYTDLANPCLGIKGNKEKGRKEVYIEDEIYNRVYKSASRPLQDAMEMTYLTGQRPSDVLKMRENDIVDGCINVNQGKTGKKLRISIEGRLKILLGRIQQTKANHVLRSLYLIVDDNGQRLSYTTLRSHFDKARQLAGVPKDQFQFRDLRAKAGTDKAESSDIWQAQKQLGHADVKMTHTYVRNRKGDKTKPTK